MSEFLDARRLDFLSDLQADLEYYSSLLPKYRKKLQLAENDTEKEGWTYFIDSNQGHIDSVKERIQQVMRGTA